VLARPGAPCGVKSGELGGYTLGVDRGAIAQLGERRAGSAKVVGSSPTSSIKPNLQRISAYDGLQIPSVGPVTMIEPDNLEPQSEALLSQRGRLDKDDSGGLRQIAGVP
jgi:hypothetical protein